MVRDDQRVPATPAGKAQNESTVAFAELPGMRRTIQRAQAGDATAFHDIYERYRPTVFGTVMRVVRDTHEAEDVTQQVFAKLMTCIGQYELRTQPFAHWLGRVARNTALDHVRRRRPIPFEDAGMLLEAQAEHSEDTLAMLKQALAALPEEQRQIILMRHLIGLSPCEIAEKTGRTTASVNGLHFRARRQLRSELSGLGLAPATAQAA